MILRKINELMGFESPEVKVLALKFGLLKGHKQYTRFIILGRSRTGSNFLRGLLDSHPAVLTLGEIFRNEDAVDFNHHDYIASKKIMNLYQSDPVEFLEKAVYRKIPTQYRALGFKLFYYHARTSPYDRLWPYLQGNKAIHIIHIKRRNMLHTHLSRARAEKTGVWVNTTGEKEKQPALTLDYESCLRDFEQTRNWEKWADQFFIQHPLKVVYYEDLSMDYSQQAAELQRFLGLDEVPVQPRTHKQLQTPLSQAIQNYSDLKQRFQASEWAAFFED